MSHEPQKWGAFSVGRIDDDGKSLQTLIDDQRSDTRIFVDKLYEEFTASAGRSRIERLAQNRGRTPWPSPADDTE